MTKDEICNELAETRKKLAELEIAIACAEQPQPYKRWRAEVGDYYHTLNEYYIACARIDKGGFNSLYNTGNYFKTEAEAEAHKQRLLATQELKDLAEGYEFTFGTGSDNYGITFGGKQFNFFNANMAQATIVYFENSHKAQHAIDTLGEEKLKLIFNIK